MEKDTIEKIVNKLINDNKSTKETNIDFKEYFNFLVELINNNQYASSDMFDCKEEKLTKYSIHEFTRTFYDLEASLSIYAENNFINEPIYDCSIDILGNYPQDSFYYIKYNGTIYTIEKILGQGSFVLLKENNDQNIDISKCIEFENFLENKPHSNRCINIENHIKTYLNDVYTTLQEENIDKELFKEIATKFISEI